jgi:Myb-like DNA-binding domain
LCRRRFNSDNYKGKWNEEEEEVLRRLVQKHGTFWQEIAKDYNATEERSRTPQNLKDKWK